MSKRNVKFTAAVYAILLSMLSMPAIEGCRSNNEGISEPDSKKSKVQSEVFLVEEVRFHDEIKGLIGTVSGNTIELAFNGQEERLISVHVKVGEKVKKGQVLFELDHIKAKARKNQAEGEYLRMKELYNVGGATELDMEDAKAGYDVAKKDLNDTYIYAPSGGYISQINKRVGETVNRGEVMGVFVSDEGELVVETGVIEEQLEAVRKGQKAFVEVDALKEGKIDGEVIGISREVSRSGRMGAIHIGLPRNMQKKLRPGLSAKCEIVIFDELTLVVPRAAYDGQNRGVYIIGDDGRAEFRAVNTGYVKRDFIEILDGLEKGEGIAADIVMNPVEDGVMVEQLGEPVRYSVEDKSVEP